ncbi:hypothetical protein B0T22DRAFT_14616 [Podospora appendiculata]|uniref:Ph domain-containing protein n=1 Tax=Podospora appendiculata TaxID=314037 RepID=A0AAE0XFV0_9PEZI|nr:hypothetical protein B0T22DRAFT_14616 [Podospora appendiculata]
MNAVVSLLGKKALGNLKKNKTDTNADNPYKERVPVYNNKGQLTKHKEQERPIPQELSRNDQKILRSVRKRAYRWDMGFRLCCFNFRFGWSAVIGIIPFIGDAIDLMMAYSVVRKASKVDGGLPPILRAKMIANIIFDFALGFIPILGDVADAFFRANTRNAWLLDAYLTAKATALREGKVQDSEGGGTLPVPEGLRIDDVESGLVQPAPAYAAAPGTGRSRHGEVETGITPAPARKEGVQGSGQTRGSRRG